MAEIRVLDKHTAELIAAGEVVERPASVAKELLENAIDAGATQITLSIVRGGIQQLQIADNGSGIEAEYIDKAFVRHATSKIASAEDLGHIHTLGFRGEALASIASVARVEVLTRTEADEYACCYRIEGGEPQGMEPGAPSLMPAESAQAEPESWKLHSRKRPRQTSSANRQFSAAVFAS